MARALLIIAILSTLASSALAQGGFRVDVAPVTPDVPSTHTQSNWQFRLQRKSVAIRWNCTCFSHAQNSKALSDATMRAAITGVQGPIVASPNASIVKTNVSHGRQSASFDMHVQGTGKLDVLVDLEIDATNAAAGDHYATVELTITGL